MFASVGVPVVVAGSDPSDHPSIYLEGGAHVVVTGEGEVTLIEVLQSMEGRSNTPLSAIEGVALRDTDAVVVRTRPRAFIRDLDQLPRPAWDLVDIERYRAIWLRRHGYFSMNVATTRGCPYHCNWCAKPIYGQRYAARGPRQVADEIAWLKRTYRPDHIWMADDIFGLTPGWIEAFARAVVERDAVVPYKCLLRADGVSAEVATALATSGCRTVWLGAESGSQAVLDAMEKGIRVDQIAAATARLRAVGIDVGFFLQFGYPGETMDDIRLTLEMLRFCRPDDIGVSVSYPLPGTPFFERVKTQLGDKRNWVDSDDLAMMYQGTYAPEFYRALHALVHGEFRKRRAGEMLARAARSPMTLLARELRHIVGGVVQAAKLPFLRRRVARLSRATLPGRTPTLIPVLNQQAASTPSESTSARRVSFTPSKVVRPR